MRRGMICGLLALMVAMPSAVAWAQSDGTGGPDIGGDIRIRTEYKRPFDYFNDDGGDPTGDDGTFMRSRFHLDWTLANNVAVFLQVQDSRTWGFESSFEGNPAFADNFQLKQAYVSLNNLQEMDSLNFLGENDLDFIVGRIELPTLGDGYIVASDPWQNNGPTTWDGFWVDSTFGGEEFLVDVDFLWADLANTDPYTTGPIGPAEGAVFWGIQAGTGSLPFVGGDVYLWNFKGDDFTGTLSDSDLMIYGVRLYDNLPEGTLDALDVVLEFALQTGELNATQDQDASLMVLRGEYALPVEGLNPVIGVGYSNASGGVDGSGDSETWISPLEYSHALLGHYDLFANSNVNDLFITSQITLMDTMDVHLDFHFMTLDDEDAGIFTARDGNSGAVGDDDLGTEIDLYAMIECGEILALQAGWSHFMPGDAIEDATGGFDDSGNFFYLQMTVPFGTQPE